MCSCLFVITELIGEEIYDEFDPEGGHRNDANYLPPTANENVNLLKRKGSAPNLTSSSNTVGVVAPTPTAANPSRTGLLRPRPLAPISTLKNLSFIRSRSAPPTPRDSRESARPVGQGGPPLEPIQSIEDPNAQSNLDGILDEKEQLKAEDAATTTAAPPIVVTPPSSPPRSPPATSTTIPIPDGSIAPSASVPAVTAAIGSGIPRGGSPAPSLGAIILDRGRQKRAAQVGVPPQAPSPRAVTPSASGGKGQRFKSSPLTPISADGLSPGAPRGAAPGSNMSAVHEDETSHHDADDERAKPEEGEKEEGES